VEVTPMRAGYRLRLAVNAANGSTLCGVLLAVAGRASIVAGPDGLTVACQVRLPMRSDAFCLGNVILTRLSAASVGPDTGLLAHEGRHATQYACCGGLAMLPLYGIAAALSWALTGNLGSRNVFERRAGLAEGGYPDRDLRPGLRRRIDPSAWRRQAP
jgi:hypothetical protein